MICPIYWRKIAKERNPDLPFTTRWFNGRTRPVRAGYYERCFTDGCYFQFWDGAQWLPKEGGQPHWRQVGDYPAWRGMTEAQYMMQTDGVMP